MRVRLCALVSLIRSMPNRKGVRLGLIQPLQTESGLEFGFEVARRTARTRLLTVAADLPGPRWATMAPDTALIQLCISSGLSAYWTHERENERHIEVDRCRDTVGGKFTQRYRYREIKKCDQKRESRVETISIPRRNPNRKMWVPVGAAPINHRTNSMIIHLMILSTNRTFVGKVQIFV